MSLQQLNSCERKCMTALKTTGQLSNVLPVDMSSCLFIWMGDFIKGIFWKCYMKSLRSIKTLPVADSTLNGFSLSNCSSPGCYKDQTECQLS